MLRVLVEDGKESKCVAVYLFMFIGVYESSRRGGT